jgi:hypothetical protein
VSSRVVKILGFLSCRTPKTPSPQTSTIGDQVLQDPQRAEPQASERTESQLLEAVHGASTSAIGLTGMGENPVDQPSAPPPVALVEKTVQANPRNLELIATQVVKELDPSHQLAKLTLS